VLTRARQDAAPVRARGVEGVQGVIDAEQRLADVRLQGTQQVADAEQRLADVRRTNDRQLASSVQSVADAQRQEAGAARDLSRTRRDAKENLDQETSSVNKLHDALMQLSPAERQLYERVLALQGVYKRVARPITDILTGAFTGVVDATIRKLQDPRIILASATSRSR
jgi:chromosome segregation ATPase